MENKKLKRKIVITNIKRIIRSFLFINIMPIYSKVVLGVSNIDMNNFPIVTCYDAGPEPIVKKTNLLVILVPIAIVIIILIGIIVGIKRRKKKKMENEDNDKN